MADPVTADATSGVTATTINEQEYWLIAWLRRRAFALSMLGLVLLFALVFFWPRMLITIGPGQEGVLWRRFVGTQVDTIYLEGTHLIVPWNRMYLYDIRLAKLDETVSVLSADGLEIDVDLSIRYRPVSKSIPQLHQQVGPDYAHRIVVPEVVTAVREVMGRYTPDQLYTLRAVEMQNLIIARAAGQVRERFVVVDDVLIRRIRLPEIVQNAIQSKLRQEQEALEYEYRLRKERQETARKVEEAAGIEALNSALSDRFLRWKGVEATLELARSANAKVVVIGSGPNGLPLILNTEGQTTLAADPTTNRVAPAPAAATRTPPPSDRER
jgi:regulator of protease activity HflC (stomatin/prohibitin superfamily)